MTFSQVRQYIKGVLSNIFNKTLSNIAPKFNPTETYSIGDMVIYNGDLYRFTSAHTGAWTTTDTSKTSVNAYLNNNSMVACGGGYAPIGTVISYMGTRAPSDFLICDGTVYNIADYTELADFFELQFGSSNFFGGDGNTTFAVPDLRGEFLRGTGTNSHANQGSGTNVGVHQDGTEIPNYIVNTDGSNGQIQANSPLLKNNRYETLNMDGTINIKSFSRINASQSQNINDGVGSYTSRPTNTSVLYCIKAKSQGNGYSLDEQIVGTWIDGKPIYQKTFNLGNLPNRSTKTVAHNISNVDIIFLKDGFLWDASAGVARVLPFVHDTEIVNVSFYANKTGVVIESRSCDWSSLIAYVTIQYTKTTD